MMDDELKPNSQQPLDNKIELFGITLKQSTTSKEKKIIQNYFINYRNKDSQWQFASNFNCKITSFTLNNKNQQNNSFFINNVLKYINCWSINFLTIEQFKQCHLLKNLSHISFDEILVLCLSNCNIDNLESISWLSVDKLTYLDISRNWITNLQSLKKTYLHRLQYFSLQNNLINVDQFSCINSLFMDKKRSKQFFNYYPNKKQLDINFKQQQETTCVQNFSQKSIFIQNNGHTSIMISQFQQMKNLNRKAYLVYMNAGYFKSDKFKYFILQKESQINHNKRKQGEMDSDEQYC